MTEQQRIHKALAAIIQATEQSSSQWIIGGSTSLMLRGIPLAADPRDLDIYCDDEDMDDLYEALSSFAIDEPVISVTDMYRSRLCHFTVHEVQVELVGGFRVQAGGNIYETMVRKLLLPFSDHAYLEGSALAASVVPLAHELWFNYLRGRADRVDMIVQAFAESPSKHEGALAAIEQNNVFTIEAKRSLHHLISAGEVGGL
ncbi:nucleotidyltransferase domain-containing protein [Paenibacillus paridis]|uniref:nucleotidyltransferase domain-containing protein n=1 Tax=Paenibacillus paridis TaxID=2583376 RepID=UPI00112026EE|nr:hypothetical protein [Paenibacillus paridis]